MHSSVEWRHESGREGSVVRGALERWGAGRGESPIGPWDRAEFQLLSTNSSLRRTRAGSGAALC